MITADYVLKCTLKRKFGDFEKIECIGEGSVVLGCSPNYLKICMGRRWRNCTDLPRGFARLVALNKKCTGSTKASVGNQSSNFECCDNGQSWRKRSRQIQKSTVHRHNGEFPRSQPSEKTTNSHSLSCIC